MGAHLRGAPVTAPTTVLEVLEKLRELYSDRTKWTYQVYARSAENHSVDQRSPRAVCWCISAALGIVVIPDPNFTYSRLSTHALFNNTVSRLSETPTCLSVDKLRIRTPMERVIRTNDYGAEIEPEIAYRRVTKMIGEAIVLERASA